MKKLVLGVVVFLVFGAVGFGWYYAYGPCGTVKVQKAMDAMYGAIDEFNDAYDVANNTPRISLSSPINQLQSIRRDANDIEVPACLKNGKKLLTGYMQTVIDGFVAFMGQASDYEITLIFLNASSQLGTAEDEFDSILACAPFCKEDPYKLIP